LTICFKYSSSSSTSKTRSSNGEPSPKVRKVVQKEEGRRRRVFKTNRQKRRKRLNLSRRVFKASIAKDGDDTIKSTLTPGQLRKAEQMRSRRRKPKDYDLRGVIGIILKAQTTSQKQEETLKWNPSYTRFTVDRDSERLQVVVYVTDIRDGLKDIRDNGRKNTIIDCEHSSEEYIRMCYSYTDGLNKGYKVIKSEDELDQWRTQYIREGYTISFSMKPLQPNFSVGNCVKIGEMAYTNNKHNQDNFSLKAKKCKNDWKT